MWLKRERFIHSKFPRACMCVCLWRLISIMESLCAELEGCKTLVKQWLFVFGWFPSILPPRWAVLFPRGQTISSERVLTADRLLWRRALALADRSACTFYPAQPLLLCSHPRIHTRLFLWIVGTFHRLLLLLYWPNNIFYPLNLPLTENLFALLHFQCKCIYYIYFFSLVRTTGRSPQYQKCQVLLYLWDHLVTTM